MKTATTAADFSGLAEKLAIRVLFINHASSGFLNTTAQHPIHQPVLLPTLLSTSSATVQAKSLVLRRVALNSAALQCSCAVEGSFVWHSLKAPGGIA
jgi:hypothetical protein